MYFLSLPSFHPSRGINTDDHGKYPFISSVEGLFEQDEFEFNFKRPFPFEQIELEDGQYFYVSEPNLLKVFKNTFSVNNHILINNTSPISQAYTKELSNQFYRGYVRGIEQFYEELGQTSLSLPLAQKKQSLKEFINYCQTHLYFEGFAIPGVLYSLGYIQSCLVLAVKDYKNLLSLADLQLAPPKVNIYPIVESPLKEEDIQDRRSPATVENESENGLAIEDEFMDKPAFTETDEAEDLSLIEPEVVNPVTKLKLKHSADDILDLWYVLLDSKLCQIMQVPQVFFSEQEIGKLLGGLFEPEQKDADKFPSGEHQYHEVAQGYQHLLSLLMHATYKLNSMHFKIPLREYCVLLQQTFSPFASIGSVNDIASNITKKKDIAIEYVTKSNGKFAKKSYAILKKVPTYILKS